MKSMQAERTTRRAISGLVLAIKVILGLTLALVATRSLVNIYGESETLEIREQIVEVADEVPNSGPNAVPIRFVKDVDLFTRLKWTLQVLFVPRTIDHVNTLYAYELEKVKDLEIHLERVAPVTMIGECRASSGSEKRWCARYFGSIPGSITSAYAAATAAAADGAGDYYFATSYPLPDIKHVHGFISDHTVVSEQLP